MNEGISYELLYGEPFSRKDCNSVNKLLKELYAGSGKPPRQADTEWFLEVVRDEHVFVARTPDQQIIGMASLVKAKKLSRKSYWVEDVVVSKKYRGQGIGRGLMSKIHWFAEQTGITILDLHSSRPEAVTLYVKLGYRERDNTKLMQFKGK